MPTSKRRAKNTYKTRKTTFALIAGLLCLILVGAMSTSLFRSSENNEPSLSAANPPAPPSPSPALVKEYIYAGDKLIATEEPVANAAPAVNITSPASNTVFTAPATVTIEADATDSDGTISKVEFYEGSNLLGTVTAAPYNFTWNNVSANTYLITAKAYDNQNATGTSAQVTVISNALPVVSITNPANNTVVTAPANITIEASAADSDGTITKVEFYKDGFLLNTDTSAPFSFAWNNVSANTYILTAKAYDNRNAVGVSSPVTVISNALPTVSITSPANNASFTAPATITIDVSASDSDGSISKVEFYEGANLLNTDTSAPYSFIWNNVSANTYTLTAKAFDNRNAFAVSGGVTVISNTLPTVSITSPANNTVFPAPATITIDASASDPDGSISKVEFYQGSTLLNTDTSAPFSFTWNNVSANTYSLTAKAFDNRNAFAVSSPVSVISNTLPTVSITSPANNATFTAPANITIDASASDADGTISKVEFYQGSTLLNTDTSAPYSFNWTNVSANNYTLTAKAFDNRNAFASSSPIAISVSSNLPPVVNITAPLNNAVFTAPANITINATATDPDGTISKVEFYQGSTLLNTDTVAPFTFAWNNVVAGTYQLTAKAYDNLNADTTSSQITVFSNTLPTVSITSPVNDSIFSAPANILINANANDADGSISKVEFYQGTTLLNTDTAPPYSFNWTNVVAGTYSLSAKAYDNRDASTTSSTITVISNTAPAVSITSPANNTIFNPPANITINATATDADGAISVVEFYQDGTLVGSDSTTPYTVTLNNVVAGAYQLTARATDNRGTTTTSAVVAVTTPTFYDDFNDNSLDLSKWNLQDSNSPAIVTEQSQQLRITLPASTATYNGIRSNATYDLRGGIAQIELVQSVSQAGFVETFIVLELDAQNHFLVQTGGGSLIMRVRTNGVNDNTIIPFDSVAHRFWRVRHNLNTSTVSFETSPDGAVWTSRKTAAAGFAVTALRFVILAGAFGTGNATPGAAIYNDVQFIPNPSLQGTPPPIFTDDFNDNSLDTAKWDANNLFSGFTSANVSISEMNQRLEIGPLLLNTGGSNYRGVRSVNTYNFTNGYTYVDLVQAPSIATSADAMFTMGVNVDNYYRIYVSAGNLIGQKKIGGTKTTLFTIPYESNNHRFLRIRHDSTTGNVTLDTAPSNSGAPGAWTQRYTETWNTAVTLTAIIFEMKGGTWQAEGNLPGKAMFDNFVFGLNSAPPSAPTVTAISPNSGLTTGGTSVTISGTGFVAGATVSLGGTAATNVNVTNNTTITATTPAHIAGVVNVVVTNPDTLSGTLNNGYTYNEPAPQETVLLADDFNDNSIDSAKWDITNLFSGFTSLSVPINETSQRLEVGPLLQNTGGSNYRGVKSINTYNFTNGYTWVELVQSPSSSTAGDAMFTIGLNVDNYYRIYVSAGNLIGQKKIGGTKTTLFSIPYDTVNHRFLRIRHTGGSLTLDTAPTNSGVPGTWTQRYSEIWNAAVALTSITFELKGGTWQAETNAPNKAIFDSFKAAVPN